MFDYDGSGNISVDELVNTIRALGLEDQASQVLNIVTASGHEGDLDFSNFLTVFGFSDSAGNSEQSLQQLFEAFDTTGSGAFGPEEF